MTRRWTLRLVAGLAAGAVVLSGCSERQEASDTLPGADASPSASEPDLPPLGPPDLPMPAEARTPTQDGARAFFEYYIEVYNHAFASMDSFYFRDLGFNCADCNLIADQLDSDMAAGLQYEGGSLRIDSMSPPSVEGNVAQLALIFTQAPLTVTDSTTGESLRELSSGEVRSPSGGAVLAWQATRSTWVVTQWDA
ncbi:hypothetical protein SAMN04488546_3614 [Geodermatophilus poikilotrophus]|uniref:SnoaL-like domain-containing protein n=1 Tax=Geodermatophilus poikilotrophus TaxID=1333667 RepID=A0A1I0H4V2_9ACTN|nr:hypothetical protein SAMN04488546_3614 [Geodermatophilus poikilotrophus]